MHNRFVYFEFYYGEYGVVVAWGVFASRVIAMFNGLVYARLFLFDWWDNSVSSFRAATTF